MVVQETVPPPAVMWAQRNSTVLLTICLEDCKNPEIKVEPDSIYFKGIGGTENKLHELTILLFKEIDPVKSVTNVRERNIELILKKKEGESGYWPQLTKEKKKYHWLKVDFNRWQDEDSSDDEFGGSSKESFEEVMRTMGGLGGGDGSKPNFDDLNDVLDSDDEEDLPELE